MELKQLEYFVSAAEELNFTRAARRCHVVQSAISAQVKALEAELGASLFDRTTQRVSLTRDGLLLLERARGILRLVDDTRDLVSPTDSELSGSLSIGVTQGAWKDMAPALATLHAEHPEVRLRLHQAPTVELFESVNDGTLDIAVVPLRDSRSQACSSNPCTQRTSTSSSAARTSWRAENRCRCVTSISGTPSGSAPSGHCARSPIERSTRRRHSSD